MFYKGVAHIVVPFKFTDEERKLIFNCFGGPVNNSQKSTQVSKFIQQIEPIIELWLGMATETLPVNSKVKSQLNHISKKCNQLTSAIEDLDSSVNNHLTAELDWFYKKNGIVLSIEDTETAIHSLKTTAQILLNRLKDRTESKLSEKSLASRIANCYMQVFDSAPGSGDESNFSKIIDVIEEILDIKIGQPTINKTASKQYSKSS